MMYAWRPRVVVLLSVASLVACSGNHRPLPRCAAAVAGGRPYLATLRPESIAVEVVATERAVITLVGCEFGSTPLDVSMGPQTVRALTPTDGGTRVTFPVPAFIASGGEAPPMPSPAGTYDIVIINARGRSGARTLTVY